MRNNEKHKGMRTALFLLTFLIPVVSASAQTDTLTVRIKGMKCEECGHKVKVAVKKLPGIEGMRFNYERRTATIAYDPQQTCPDSIEARLAATHRYKASPYSPSEVIRRGFGLRMDDMHCQHCADRITKKLQTIEGVDSTAPHLDKHYFFIRYDANRTCKAEIREALLSLGFTPVNYYTGPKVANAYYILPDAALGADAAQARQSIIDEVLILDGVEDVNVNIRRKSLAVTYFTDETTPEKLLADIRAAGIGAQVPPQHECKEKD